MDRQQKIHRIANQSGRVSKVSNLQVTPNYIHQGYKSEPCDGVISETGELQILKVVPVSGNGPYFIARWDQRPEHLDIDMHGASKGAIRKFKKRQGAYGGHHTERNTDPNQRVFDVKIEMPEGVIFDGTLSFSNTYEVINALRSESKVIVDMTVIRAGPETEGA